MADPKSIAADRIVTACRSATAATAREMMQHRKEAPSMYEMEGASEPSGADGPIARARETAEHATIGRRSLDEPRSTRCPPPEKAPFQGGPPVRQTLPRTLNPGHSLSRTPGPR